MNKPHALIVDDNTANVQLLSYFLEDHGVQTTSITNPKHLDAVLDTLTDIDLIFLDLEMPGMSGYEALAWLQSDERCRDAIVVACTVHLNEMKTARQVGFHSFIGKPLNTDKFPGQLDRLLRGQTVWEAS